MNRELLMRLVRRAVVLATTGAVIAAAVMSVQLAAAWRASEAPLNAAPVGLTTIEDQYTVESERAGDVDAQLSGVARQVSDLQAALIAADSSISGDAASASKLQHQLAAAKDKLTTVQKQLKAAQARLNALNRAAARQAALNRQAATSVRTGGGGGGGGGERDDGEHERGDDD